MEPAYPLRCQPLFRDYLWGGRNLQTRLGKEIPAEGKWAESWELLDHPQHSSQVVNGPLKGKKLSELIARNRTGLLGDTLTSLPLLLKYLDCQDVLSVQVHPNDEYALKMTPPDLGKTEAWYVIDRKPGSVLYAGLRSGVDQLQLKEAIKAGTVDQCLHVIEPQPGDCVFIPAGTVHALGAGLLVAEIQQASNTTFRLFDWNRVGPDGKLRELHIQQSLDVSDYNSGPRSIQVPQATSQTGRERLVSCDKFCFDRIRSVECASLAGDGRFHFVTVPNGRAMIRGEGFQEQMNTGESLLLPAALETCFVRSRATRHVS
jgi:mannose-6-phosphate isomerase